MNRLPRRPPRVQPPVRGRAAAESSPRSASTSYVVSQPSCKPIVKVVEKPVCKELDPGWIALYQRWSKVFKVLETPQKWLAILVLLIGLSFMFGLYIRSLYM